MGTAVTATAKTNARRRWRRACDHGAGVRENHGVGCGAGTRAPAQVAEACGWAASLEAEQAARQAVCEARDAEGVLALELAAVRRAVEAAAAESKPPRRGAWRRRHRRGRPAPTLSPPWAAAVAHELAAVGGFQATATLGHQVHRAQRAAAHAALRTPEQRRDVCAGRAASLDGRVALHRAVFADATAQSGVSAVALAAAEALAGAAEQRPSEATQGTIAPEPAPFVTPKPWRWKRARARRGRSRIWSSSSNRQRSSIGKSSKGSKSGSLPSTSISSSSSSSSSNSSSNRLQRHAGRR